MSDGPALSPGDRAVRSPAPFGAVPVPRAIARWRGLARFLPDTVMGRALERLIRKRAVRGLDGPFDVTLANGTRVRLHRDNNCERKNLFGSHLWNRVERAHIAAALERAPRPATFIDLGANVGLYTLDALAGAARAGFPLKAIAVEPDPENRARLEDNLAFSGLDAVVVPAASGPKSDAAHLVAAPSRGRVNVRTGAAGAAVEMVPLATLCAQLGVRRIDALKSDLEGWDKAVLTAFLDETPPRLHPRVIVAEAGREDADGLIPAVCQRGYDLAARTYANAVLMRRGTNAARTMADL